MLGVVERNIVAEEERGIGVVFLDLEGVIGEEMVWANLMFVVVWFGELSADFED